MENGHEREFCNVHTCTPTLLKTSLRNSRILFYKAPAHTGLRNKKHDVKKTCFNWNCRYILSYFSHGNHGNHIKRWQSPNLEFDFAAHIAIELLHLWRKGIYESKHLHSALTDVYHSLSGLILIHGRAWWSLCKSPWMSMVISFTRWGD